ncbi:hypothetical protein L3V83_15135 [Thiotrichales bacterium 19X7-9]|nr:hypothetical protein [Thiotrichales bacterium 19X7-9]
MTVNTAKGKVKISTLFRDLKKRGFNLENTHLTSPKKLSKLMFITVLAFIWSYACGERLTKIKSPKIKKHGYFYKSIVKIGLEDFGKAIARMHIDINQLIELIMHISASRKVQNIKLKLSGVL